MAREAWPGWRRSPRLTHRAGGEPEGPATAQWLGGFAAPATGASVDWITNV